MVEALLNEMKEKGIGGAVVRADGVPVASTIALKEVDAGLFASVAGVADAILKKSGDAPKEIEISFNNIIVVMVPVKNHIFCGIIKSREEKSTVLEYAERAKSLL